MTTVEDMEKRKASVRALVSLISSATEDALCAWERDMGRVPCLDDLDEDKTPSPALERAMRLLDGSCHQLCVTLRPTFFTVMNETWSPIEAACLRTAVEAKVADILNGRQEGVHVSEIASESGLDAFKLSRILRLLSVKHCFREVSKDIFANNRASYSLRSSSATSSFVGLMMGEINQKGIANLFEALSDPEYGPSTDERRSVFSWGIRDELLNANLFDYYTKHPDRGARFNRAMTSIRLGYVNDYFPVASLPAGTTWCDVGGGMGGALIPVAQSNPSLRLTLQDLPPVLGQAVQHIRQKYPEGLQRNRINFVPLNFLKEPPVPDQDIYYMRYVIHDWSDNVSTIILKNVRKAMKPSSRLLIHDFVLMIPDDRSTNRSEHVNAHAQDAPYPLLPNYGAGGIRPFLADIKIMVATNAKERSVEDLIHIASEADLEFVRFWDCVETSMVEFRIVQGQNGSVSPLSLH